MPIKRGEAKTRGLRAGIELALVSSSGGVLDYTNVFQPGRPDARSALGRDGSVGRARWPPYWPHDVRDT